MSPDDLILLAEARMACADGSALALCERANLSQAEMGASVGVSAATVSRWLHGQRVPRGRAAVRWARLLRRLREEIGEPDAAA